MTFSEGYDIQSMVPPVRSGGVAGPGGGSQRKFIPATSIYQREGTKASVDRGKYIPAPINQGEHISAPINEGDYTPAPITQREHTLAPINHDDTKAHINEGDYFPAPITQGEHSLAPINEEYIPAPINQDDTKAPINQGEYTPAPEHIIFFDYAQITIRTFFAWRGSYISSCMRYISLHLNCTYSL